MLNNCRHTGIMRTLMLDLTDEAVSSNAQCTTSNECFKSRTPSTVASWVNSLRSPIQHNIQRFSFGVMSSYKIKYPNPPLTTLEHSSLHTILVDLKLREIDIVLQRIADVTHGTLAERSKAQR